MTTASRPLDIEALRGWIGRTATAEDSVTVDLASRFNATLDVEADTPRTGDGAPLAIHWCLAPAVAPTAGLGQDGHPARGGFLPPVPLPRRMWAGGMIEFAEPLRIGATVRRTSRIADVVVKEGRTGPLCFVTVMHDYGVADRIAIREQHDIVYRGLHGGSSSREAAPVPPARWTTSKEAGPPLLFRYSALTFNGHRIHYDRRYCIETEGYPGLVVHGPLQATLLLQFAATIHGSPPRTFAFRSTAPIFDGAPFTLNADEGPGGLSLWTADAAGRRAMAAEATWPAA